MGPGSVIQWSTWLPENPPKHVYLETFGCQMNVLDSELVMGELRQMGYEPTENLRAADLQFTPDDLREISTATSNIEVQGARGSGHERYG